MTDYSVVLLRHAGNATLLPTAPCITQHNAIGVMLRDAWICADDVWVQWTKVRYGGSYPSLCPGQGQNTKWQGCANNTLCVIDSWRRIILSHRPILQRGQGQPPVELELIQLACTGSMLEPSEHSWLSETLLCVGQSQWRPFSCDTLKGQGRCPSPKCKLTHSISLIYVCIG